MADGSAGKCYCISGYVPDIENNKCLSCENGYVVSLAGNECIPDADCADEFKEIV